MADTGAKSGSKSEWHSVVEPPTPEKGAKTQSPSPLDPASRRVSDSLVQLTLNPENIEKLEAAHVNPNSGSRTTVPMRPGSAARPGVVSPFNSLNSPGASFAALSNAATNSPGPGRRTPTNYTNNVTASVVRNALPQDGGASPEVLMGMSYRMAEGLLGGGGGSTTAGSLPYHQLESGTMDPHSSAVASSRGAGDDQLSTTAGDVPTPANGYLLPSGTGASVAADANPAPPDPTPFSREQAEKNFAKARDLVLEHIRARCERRTKGATDASAAEANDQSSAASDKGAGTTPKSKVTSPDQQVTSVADLAVAEEADGDGGRLFNVICDAMKAADTIDNGEGNATSNTSADWRDDDVVIQSPSAFFRSPVNLGSTSNRVMETIIAKGHAAATDDELRWLYRRANLLNLLDKDDLCTIVSASMRREYMKGETIANQYSSVRHLYTVLWGDVEVFRINSLDDERRELESAFRVTAVMQDEQQQRDLRQSKANNPIAYAPVRTSAHDLVEIQTTRQAHSRSLATNAFSSVNSDASDEDDTIYTHFATLLPGQVFGTESFVFDQTNNFVFRAGGSTKKTVVALVPFSVLMPSLESNPRFAQGVGSAIAGSVDVFGPIRQFCRYVFSPQSSQNDYLPLWSIVAAYTHINNVIHTKLFSKELDTGAWGYALNRLPENVTSTFCFDLVHALPPFVASRMRVEAYAADVSKAPQPPSAVSRARTAVAYIRTKERRRCTWHLGMEGKDLVLLRDGFTDLLDFLTMLCVHIIESNKLRGRVQGMVHPPAIDILDSYLRQRDEELADNKTIAVGEEMERIKDVLARMPLTPDEQRGLLRNWGQDTLLKIYEVMMHREEYNIRVDPSTSRRFQINPFHEWALNLRGCVMEKLGMDRSHALPDDLFIDVVSSNTHCIKNLLCSFNRTYRKEILDYAVRKEGNKLGQPEAWHTVEDMIYAATAGFLRDERPDLKEELQRSLEENGITVLHDTAMTGLQVDVIPVHCLNLATIDETIRRSLRDSFEEAVHEHCDGESGASFRCVPTWAQVCKPMHALNSLLQHKQQERANRRKSLGTATRRSVTDESPSPESSPASPSLPVVGSRLRRHFIINMDFAFGAQAEGICRAIFSAFGKHIRSVSVMGKAGGMQGKRGDIQLASHVLLSKSSLILEDNQDELRSCRNQDLTKERLQELAGPNVTVHHGKVLTVTGTMLQNVPLLRYYKNVWRCVGTEMEGSYFARVIEDFYRQGIANTDLHTRFAYYTSDLPLAQSDAEEAAKNGKRHGGSAATLSAPMTPQEGVPPLYAIARGILENVLLS